MSPTILELQPHHHYIFINIDRYITNIRTSHDPNCLLEYLDFSSDSIDPDIKATDFLVIDSKLTLVLSGCSS